MKAPKKVITAMAIATLLGTGVGQAFADSDFVPDTGNAANDEKPLQTAIKNVNEQSNVQGDIKINGEFSKSVNSFPTITEAGEYIRVTMPISLNYKYNLDDHILMSGNGEIKNQSVKAVKEGQGEQAKVKLTDNPVKMSFVDITTENEKVEYVDTIQETGMENKVQLPFQLVMTRNGVDFDKVSLASMKDGAIKDKYYVVQPGSTLELKIDKINSQKVTGSFDQDKISVQSNMTLKFEYMK